jgi:hypothetical protein
MGETRNEYKILIGKPEWKRPLGRPRRRWENPYLLHGAGYYLKSR